jgi:hypothetical protein
MKPQVPPKLLMDTFLRLRRKFNTSGKKPNTIRKNTAGPTVYIIGFFTTNTLICFSNAGDVLAEFLPPPEDLSATDPEVTLDLGSCLRTQLQKP